MGLRVQKSDPAAPSSDVRTADTANLRLLATTDIHMQLLGHDYVAERKLDHHGLAGIATLIAQARAEARAEHRGCVLFDNGDMLQGSALGDWIAGQKVNAGHPVVQSLNHLRYDAIGVGNHDLDYGLDYLQQVAAKLDMPVICSNLTPREGLPDLRQSALIDCVLPSVRKGTPRALRLGVLSVLPAQTAVWNRHLLKGRADVDPALTALHLEVPKLRAAGADLVILLAHVGIGSPLSDASEDNALRLAEVPGIDAVITGHTHQRFPGAEHASRAGVDADSGTLAQLPAIMPGYAGSDLAVLDLTLTQRPDGTWQVVGHDSRLRRNRADTAPDPAIIAACTPAHSAVRNHLATPVGRTASTLHNYFSMAMPTATCALTARAKARVIRAAVAGTPDADLPLLAAVPAHTAGGRDGPDNYLFVPKGPMLRRHLTGLSPYANEIWALRVTGACLHNMLEQSALVFATLHPGRPDQSLTDPDVPAFNFDTIFGLTCRIDPTRARTADYLHQPRGTTRCKGSAVPFGDKPVPGRRGGRL